MIRISILYGLTQAGDAKTILCGEDHAAAEMRLRKIREAKGQDGKDSFCQVWLQTSSLPCLAKDVFPSSEENACNTARLEVAKAQAAAKEASAIAEAALGKLEVAIEAETAAEAILAESDADLQAAAPENKAAAKEAMKHHQAALAAAKNTATQREAEHKKLVAEAEKAEKAVEAAEAAHAQTQAAFRDSEPPKGNARRKK